QTRQIGVMKAVGGSTGQILAMYLVLILAFGIAGLLIAVPLSKAAAQSVGNGMAAWLNFQPARFSADGATLTQQVFVAVVVPMLAALWPIYNSVRVTVREAISDYGISGGTRREDRSVGHFALWFPRPLRLSLQNAFRRKARMALTLTTLVLAGAI